MLKNVTSFLFLLIILLLSSWGVQAQKVALNGKVTDEQTGEPLMGASVFVREAKRGATTDVDGAYSVIVNAGTYNVNVGYIGYGSKNEKLTVSEKVTTKNFELAEQTNQLEEVVVRAEGRANVTKAEMSVEKLDIKTIKRIPALMGEVDVIKSIMLLPGVQPAAEGTSSFNVRGGSHDQNLILFDNSTIYNASHFMGFFSVFNNDVVDDAKLYKGDIPAGYGGRLSSLLDVNSKHGDMEKFNFNGGIGLISSRLEIDGPILDNKLSFMVAGRLRMQICFCPWRLRQLYVAQCCTFTI